MFSAITMGRNPQGLAHRIQAGRILAFVVEMEEREWDINKVKEMREVSRTP